MTHRRLLFQACEPANNFSFPLLLSFFVTEICFTQNILFLSDPGKPGVRSLGPEVTDSLRDVWLDLTDVTLADEDTKSKLTDNAKRAIQGNEGIQAMQSGDQCKFASIGSGASW